MDMRNDIREFLTSRRGRLKAADVGLPDFGPRRVPGLRREEVAVLAGVSVPYYTRLERGDLSGASDSVLEALARALELAAPRREPCSHRDPRHRILAPCPRPPLFGANEPAHLDVHAGEAQRTRRWPYH